MDDWNASACAPAVSLSGAPDYPGSVTEGVDRARSFMDDSETPIKEKATVSPAELFTTEVRPCGP